jgi:hypothetical protein
MCDASNLLDLKYIYIFYNKLSLGRRRVSYARTLRATSRVLYELSDGDSSDSFRVQTENSNHNILLSYLLCCLSHPVRPLEDAPLLLLLRTHCRLANNNNLVTDNGFVNGHRLISLLRTLRNRKCLLNIRLSRVAHLEKASH